METYRNVPMSFADACLVCMVEDEPGAAVFTLDRDFTIYRQHRRRVIPLIAPF
jgi:predicted nucleic acid-binding protein